MNRKVNNFIIFCGLILSFLIGYKTGNNKNHHIQRKKPACDIHKLAYYLNQTPNGYPIEGYISSGFGIRVSPFDSTKLEFHKGIDIVPTTLDDTVRATHEGYIEAGFEKTYGNYVFLYSNFYMTKYAHLDKVLVKNGDKVEKHTPLGICGKTGKATGIHLHYEVLSNGRNLDPERFLTDRW